MSCKKKLTITIDEEIYNNLYTIIGSRKISKFIEELLKPHLINNRLDEAYNAMSNDQEREQEAYDWIEGVL